MENIPNISDDKLNEYYARIKPVARFAYVKSHGRKKLEPDPDGDLYYIKHVNLREIAFTWDPKPAKKASGLEKLADIETFHTYGYYGLFKPSIAEVIAQIPWQYVSKAAAFETGIGDVVIDGNYHRTTTTLYQRKEG
jgi:hypothetical protein